MMRALDLRSAASPEATEHPELDAELKLARVRAQVAVVRTLTDHIERFAHVADLEGLREQVVEEMARLECRLYEASMAKRGRPEQSGVFRCSLATDDLPIVSPDGSFALLRGRSDATLPRHASSTPSPERP